MFKLVGVHDDIDLTNCDDDLGLLDALAEAILEEKPISGFKVEKPILTLLDVLRLKLLLFIIPDEAGATCRILNYDHSEVRSTVEIGDGEKVTVPVYSILKAEHQKSAANINLQASLGAFTDSDCPVIASQANSFFLELLHAYDFGGQDERILDTAVAFAEWLHTKRSFFASHVTELNLLQTYKRVRDLKDNERKQLVAMIRMDGQVDGVLLAANALLGNVDVARAIFQNMPVEEQEKFKTFPIYRFVNVVNDVIAIRRS